MHGSLQLTILGFGIDIFPAEDEGPRRDCVRRDPTALSAAAPNGNHRQHIHREIILVELDLWGDGRRGGAGGDALCHRDGEANGGQEDTDA